MTRRWQVFASSESGSSTSPAFWWVLLLACLFFVSHPRVVRADTTPTWKTGAELTKELRGTVGFTWSERPLRDGLTALSRDTSVAIFLDRRVDPDQKVDFSTRDVPLSEALKRLATEKDLSIGMAGSVVYVGPKDAAARVQGLAAIRKREAESLARQSHWTSATPMTWDDLAEPRSLAEGIASVAHAKITNANSIPHDVWSGWSGPPLAPLDQLTLLLAGFDLTFRFEDDGETVKLVPVPHDLVFEHVYTVSSSAASVIAELKRTLPGVTSRSSGASRVAVIGTAEQHVAVAKLLEGQRTTTRTIVKPGEKRYTLTVSNEPIGAVVRTIAKELEVEVKADPLLAGRLQQRTSLKVKQLTVEQLLHKVLDPVGIQFKLNGESLELSEK